MDEIGCLLSQKPLAKRMMYLEPMCKRNGFKEEDIYSIFSFEILHNLHFGIVKTVEDVFDSVFGFERAL